MRLGRGIAGITDDGTVFTERLVPVKRAVMAALRVSGQFRRAVPVGRIRALQFVQNPIYPRGCSPNYGSNGAYETCRHCVAGDDICRVRDAVDMSDGSGARVVYAAPLRACESWICWVFARWINRFGWVLDRCIELRDNAFLNRGNEGRLPDLVLFAGSEDRSLALFVLGIERTYFSTPFKVRVQSVNYAGGEPEVIEWETAVDGTGIFLVWFGENYVLPFRAYYSYPSAVPVRPGFSGSNAFIVRA
jgi:hypothetical protein